MVNRYALFSTVVSSLYHDIQRIERTEMTKYGLKGPHAQCLLVMSQHPEGITAAQLCTFCDRDKAAISRTVAELEKTGMLTRQQNHGVRYRMPLFLTEVGRQAAENVKAVAMRAVEQAGAGLEDAQRDVFYQVLGTIAQNLQTISRDGLKEKE
ncbi:MAG: MarR family winged helix-turn-helix transcriptional regulator [Faecousia sp.]